MGNSRVWLSFPGQTRSMEYYFVSLFDKISFRPKTATMMPILAGIGYYSFDWLRTNLKSDEPKEKRQPRIWDLYDPQGHHEIDME